MLDLRRMQARRKAQGTADGEEDSEGTTRLLE
jgi:hypothetical protein